MIAGDEPPVDNQVTPCQPGIQTLSSSIQGVANVPTGRDRDGGGDVGSGVFSLVLVELRRTAEVER